MLFECKTLFCKVGLYATEINMKLHCAIKNDIKWCRHMINKYGMMTNIVESSYSVDWFCSCFHYNIMPLKIAFFSTTNIYLSAMTLFSFANHLSFCIMEKRCLIKSSHISKTYTCTSIRECHWSCRFLSVTKSLISLAINDIY